MHSSVSQKANKDRIEAIMARSTLYQFLSTCFLEPDDKVIAILKDSSYRKDVEEALHNYLKLCVRNGEADDADDLEAQLKGILDSFDGMALEEMLSEHGRLFGAHLISKDCPICESFYGTADIFQLTDELADISGFYRAFGLETSEELKERIDHLGTELEFMHFLTYKEAYALENNDGEEKAAICLEGEKKFLKAHLGRWVGHFSKLVDKKALQGLYPQLTRFLKRFVSLEMRHLGIEAEEATEINMDVLKEDDFECTFSPKDDGREGLPC